VAYYGNVVNCDKFFHVLRLLHFSYNERDPYKPEDNYSYNLIENLISV
jgi:hypothetical protein